MSVSEARTAYNVQRDFALNSGLRSQIIWDSLAPDESHILEEKIKILIPYQDEKKTNIIEGVRKTLFNSVWTQRKYTNGVSLSTIIYVIVTEESDINRAKCSTRFSCHPVFRTRKCLRSSNSYGCCMLFIDEGGRVYKNWSHYLKTNVLPKGLMIAPANGIYTFDADDNVLLQFQATPASCKSVDVLQKTDTVAGVGSLVATLPLAVTLFTPVAAPLMVAATAVTLTTAAYTTVRSAMQLTDRGSHEQSIALTNRSARGNWLSIASGAVGIGASGATKAFTYATTAGREITLATRIAVNGINVSSVLLSGTGFAHSVYEIFLKKNYGEDVGPLDLLQLASAFLVFTHSINNLKIVSRATSDMNGSLSLRKQLTRNVREILNKINNETISLRSSLPDGGGQVDIVRTVNDIPLGNVLQSLHTLNSNLGLIDNVAAKAAGTSTTRHVLPDLILKFCNGDPNVNVLLLAQNFGVKFVQHITNPHSMLDVMNAMATHFKADVLELFLSLTRTFIENFIEAIDRTLCTFVSTESVLYKMLMHCVKTYTNFSYTFLESKTIEILNATENYFESLNPSSNVAEKTMCKLCNGYFFVSAL